VRTSGGWNETRTQWWAFVLEVLNLRILLSQCSFTLHEVTIELLLETNKNYHVAFNRDLIQIFRLL
jgi:hypothetical protein